MRICDMDSAQASLLGRPIIRIGLHGGVSGGSKLNGALSGMTAVVPYR